MSDSRLNFGYQNRLTLEEICRYARQKNCAIGLCDAALLSARMAANHSFFLRKVDQGATIYGATTGFGSSSANRLPAADTAQLQRNLMQYHGCGVGGFLPEDECAAILMVRINCLVQGCSGVPFELVDKLVRMADARIIPAIPAQGSVGASGDLTPLSYIAAALTGLRKVYYRGEIIPAGDALMKHALTPYVLQGRDALALMNGTAAMSGIMALAVADLEEITRVAACATALLVELTQGRTAPFAAALHRLKPHAGQKRAARWIEELLHDSTMRYTRRTSGNVKLFNFDESIQDKYSLRCAPQLIGALCDLVDYAKTVLTTEINSVSDNPLFLDDEEMILNGGNFYGGHIGTTCDALKTALGSVANLMDRQMALLMSHDIGALLGENLVDHSLLGTRARLNHGFKAMQITLSALTAEILQNSTSATIFSRPTESGNQDVVSMGTIAARSLARMIGDTKRGAAILAMALCQGYTLAAGRGYEIPLTLAAAGWLKHLKHAFLPLVEDRPMDDDIEAMKDAIFGEGGSLGDVCR